jgi:hypothetical protein
MALHGGHSKAHNAPGGGLIIELYIPRAQASSLPISGQEAVSNTTLAARAALLSAQVYSVAGNTTE